ncbi:hypothetical protein BJ912DRAFT_928570 [Pholiota molesta]|nr:hypothetical protein BJ912DRAFT_928570 [Pholiota molesta]
MQMAAKRQVTREEDGAYSLMGILDVCLSIAYGEGLEHAFSRLLKEIINSSSNITDLFNWAGTCGSRISTLLPPTPKGYLGRVPKSQRLDTWREPIEPFLLTHLGLRITVVLMPAILTQNSTSQCDPIGEYHAVTDISIEYDGHAGNYSILDARISGSNRFDKDRNWSQLTLGVLNVAKGRDQEILVPKYCLAVCLNNPTSNAGRIHTKAPIFFVLNKGSSSDEHNTETDDTWIDPENDSEPEYYSIKGRELASHGMKVVTLHL